MTYSSETVIPLETRFLTMRTDQFDDNGNKQFLFASLDLIEERREIAIIKLAHYQQRLRQGYDKGLKVRAFVPRDLVLRKVVGNMKNLAWGKLGPNWEGPYRVTSVARTRAYHMEEFDKNTLPQPWNVNNLHRYYY